MTSSVLRSALNVLQPRNIPNTPASPASPTSPGTASPRSRHHSRRSNAENVDFAKGLAPLPPTRSPPATAAKSTPTINSNDDNEVLQDSSIITIGEIKDDTEEVVPPSQQQPEWSGGVEAEDLGRRLELLSQVDEEDPADLEGPSTPPLSTPRSSSRASTPSLGSPLGPHRALTMTPISIKTTEADAMPTSSSSNTSVGDASSVVLSREEQQVEEALEEELVPCLSPQDISFSERNLTLNRQPTTEEVRRILAAHFPYLKHPPPKPRSPNAPPSASLPPKATMAEQAARIASLVIGLEDVETRSVLKGQVVLESRRPAWKVVERLDANKVDPSEDVADLACMPNPWLLPIDAPLLLGAARAGANVKRTFELPDFRVKAACLKCAGARRVANEDADACFACEGSNVRAGRACEFCTGVKKQTVCGECEGAGVAVYGFTVEVKLRLLDLPPIKVSSLIGERTGVSCFEVRELARAKIMSIIDKICLDSATRSTPVIAVMAAATWEHSLIRTYSVVRPLQVKLLKPQRSQGTLSPAPSIQRAGRVPAFKPLSAADAVETRYYAIPSIGKPWERQLRDGRAAVKQGPRSRSSSLAGFFYPVDAHAGFLNSTEVSINENGNKSEAPTIKRRNSIASLFMRRDKKAHETQLRGSMDDVQRIPIVAIPPASNEEIQLHA